MSIDKTPNYIMMSARRGGKAWRLYKCILSMPYHDSAKVPPRVHERYLHRTKEKKKKE